MIKQTTRLFTQLSAEEGFILTNGEVFSPTIYLGKNDKDSNWLSVDIEQYKVLCDQNKQANPEYITEQMLKEAEEVVILDTQEKMEQLEETVIEPELPEVSTTIETNFKNVSIEAVMPNKPFVLADDFLENDNSDIVKAI